MEHVILANGAFPEREASLELLRHAKVIICCDGAVEKLLAHGIRPTVIVGDCDSMPSTLLTQWADILAIDKSEEYNDLQKALKYCLNHGIDNITLLGCGGLRDDHFIANLSIMATYSSQMSLTMVNDNGSFHVIHQTTTMDATPGQQISVFTKDEHLPLTFHGLKYPVNGQCFKHLWEGSLNEALGDTFTIELPRAGVVIVYKASCN